ncbi:MAG: putative maltokinase, partial [Thermodesulfobacteriota bacterium]
VPEEVFSGNKFPVIKDSPYVLTLGFHDYFWFLLRKQKEVARIEKREDIPDFSVSGNWNTIFRGKAKERLEREILPVYLERCRWFGGKARKMQGTKIVENIPMENGSSFTQLLFIEVQYVDGLSDVYLLPVSFSSENDVEKISKENPQAVISYLKCGDTKGYMYDGIYGEGFRTTLVQLIGKRQSVKGINGEITTYSGKIAKNNHKAIAIPLEKSQVLKAEQSNTSLLYGNKLFFKLYRKLDEGINPDLEIGKFLSEEVLFSNVPSFAGAVEYRREGVPSVVLGLLQNYVPNQGDAWKLTLDSLRGYFERVLSRKSEVKEIQKASLSLLDTAFQEIPVLFHELIGGVYLEMTRLLGKRTAELHLALSSNTEDPNFAPEPFSMLYQRSLYQSMQSLTKKVFGVLRKNLKNFSDDSRQELDQILGFEKKIMECFRSLLRKKVAAMKIRIHGDYHLGQVLYTGNDFVIIDFEGEPLRALSERRLKRSPLRDVAGMIRSFHYAAFSSIFNYMPIKPEEQKQLETWAFLWYKNVVAMFLRSYLDTVKDAPFIPRDKDELNVMLRAYLIEKAVYEIGYEMNNRPEWLIIPMKGIKDLIEI